MSRRVPEDLPNRTGPSQGSNGEPISAQPIDDLFRGLADALPATYPERFDALVQISNQVHARLAALLQPALQDHLQTCPQATLAEKRALASWVNGQLHELGLAVRCPVTGRPAHFLVDRRDTTTDYCRFRLEVTADDGRKRRTLSSARLPTIELMKAGPRKESFAKWTDRLSHAPSKRER